jgi:peptidyl-prolyl cis-trans isomerase B (cyclophilin B)
VPNHKQTKRELKAAKRAAREEARRAERRRAMMTVGIVAAVVLIGGALIAYTLIEQAGAEAEAERAAAEAASEAARQASEEAEQIADREVACGASAPAAADSEPKDYEEPEQVLEDGVDYSARVTTSCGAMTIDLAEDVAPETVNSFVFLAREGFFDGLEIFRNATTIGALQTGAGDNDPTWDIGYTLPDELGLAESDGYPPGAVAMANSGPDTAGSQFFFVYNDTFSLDPAYTRFGTVTDDGLPVLERIGAIETIGAAGETPGEVVYLEQVEILTDDSAGSGASEGASESPGDRPSDGATDGER